MIKTNTEAFDFIITQLENRYGIKQEKAKRYLATTALEKDILKKTKLAEKRNLTPTLTILDTNYRMGRFIVLLGMDNSLVHFDNEHYEQIPINSGIVTILLSEELLHFAPNINAKKFEDEIMYQHLGDKYKGHEWYDLAPFFQPVTILQLKKESILYNKGSAQIAVNIISVARQPTVLNFETEILDQYSILSLTRDLKIPFDLFLNSLLTSKYKFCFLELYRAVERLFPIIYLKDFHITANSAIGFPDFVRELENITSWKPKEDEALRKLIETTPEGQNHVLADLALAKGYHTNISKYIYKLRNSIVHFRMLHEEIEHNAAEWNDLIFGILNLIEIQYTRFKGYT